MGKPFFYAVITVLSILLLLFFPIYLQMDGHYDMNRRKFAFGIYLYGRLRVLGGYVGVYPGGIAVHVSEKKAFLIPYNQMNSERKRFSFMRTFRLVSFVLTTETGAEYLLPVSYAHMFLRTYFFSHGAKNGNNGKKERIENNVWLTDGDVLRVSASVALRFTLFQILKNIILFLKEKLKTWRKKKEKSTV